MKKKIVIPVLIIFLISVACQLFGKPATNANNGSSQTQDAESEIPAAVTPTRTQQQQNFSIGSETVSEKDGMTLVFVPSGEFTMGMNTEDALAECQKFRDSCSNWFADQAPTHFVDLDSFWIGKTEVTNKMYSLCVNSGSCKEPDKARFSSIDNYYNNPEFDNYPIVSVDWNMATIYCKWAGGDLPTEAQWEKAARGESENIYPWGNDFDGTLGNFCDINCPYKGWANKAVNDGYAEVSPVGNYPLGQSVYGTLDMAGNVSEWVSDWYDDNYYAISPSTNPLGPDNGRGRVIRGGGWGGELIATTSYRTYFDPNKSSELIGFRCVYSINP